MCVCVCVSVCECVAGGGGWMNGKKKRRLDDGGWRLGAGGEVATLAAHLCSSPITASH